MSSQPKHLVVVVPLLVLVVAVAIGRGWVPDMGAEADEGGDRPAAHALDPALRAAVREAGRDARADGVEFHITSGWRSRAHQQRLLDEAIEAYGSREEALRYVATPDDSAHVRGAAVDIGPTEADSWLMQHGSDYGLCQIFANEIWHYELATEPGGTCPAPLADGTSR